MKTAMALPTMLIRQQPVKMNIMLMPTWMDLVPVLPELPTAYLHPDMRRLIPIAMMRHSLSILQPLIYVMAWTITVMAPLMKTP